MIKINSLYWIIIMALCVSFLSFLFGKGMGFAVYSYLEDGDFYLVKNLGGTSANDNHMIGVGFYIFLLSAFVALPFALKGKGAYVLVVGWLSALAQLFCLYLVETEALLKLFADTILYGGNYVLAAWAIFFFGYVVNLMRATFFIYGKGNREEKR